MEKKKRFAIIVFIIGIIVLVTGITFLLIKNLGSSSGIQDGEYLVEKKTWVLEGSNNMNPTSTEAVTNCTDGSTEADCAPTLKVIWEFTEIGKGTLTTNNHLNDYDFIWAIEDGKLKIETNWLYLLENEYDYELDQSSGKLTLSSGDNIYHFVVASD